MLAPPTTVRAITPLQRRYELLLPPLFADTTMFYLMPPHALSCRRCCHAVVAAAGAATRLRHARYLRLLRLSRADATPLLIVVMPFLRYHAERLLLLPCH